MIFAAARTFSSGPCDAAPLQSVDLRCARLARALVLAANAGMPVPDGFGMAVFFLTL